MQVNLVYCLFALILVYVVVSSLSIMLYFPKTYKFSKCLCIWIVHQRFDTYCVYTQANKSCLPFITVINVEFFALIGYGSKHTWPRSGVHYLEWQRFSNFLAQTDSYILLPEHGTWHCSWVGGDMDGHSWMLLSLCKHCSYSVTYNVITIAV